MITIYKVHEINNTMINVEKTIRKTFEIIFFSKAIRQVRDQFPRDEKDDILKCGWLSG